jgi:hypothetical protein
LADGAIVSYRTLDHSALSAGLVVCGLFFLFVVAAAVFWPEASRLWRLFRQSHPTDDPPRWYQFSLGKLLVLMGIVAMWMAARPSIECFVFGEGDPCESSGVEFKVDFGCYRDTDDGYSQKGHFVLSAGFGTQLYLIALRFHPDALAYGAIACGALLTLKAWRKKLSPQHRNADPD